jgi:hypothetical protein
MGEDNGSCFRTNAHISESRYGAPWVRTGPPAQMVDCSAMPHGATTLLTEKLDAVAIDIDAIDRLINSEPLDTSDQLLALRTIQELYRRLADDLRVAISLFE